MSSFASNDYRSLTKLFLATASSKATLNVGLRSAGSFTRILVNSTMPVWSRGLWTSLKETIRWEASSQRIFSGAMNSWYLVFSPRLKGTVSGRSSTASMKASPKTSSSSSAGQLKSTFYNQELHQPRGITYVLQHARSTPSRITSDHYRALIKESPLVTSKPH